MPRSCFTSSGSRPNAWATKTAAYDALLDDFEPDAKTADVAAGARRAAELSWCRWCRRSCNRAARRRSRSCSAQYPAAAQEAFGKAAAAAIGFDFHRGPARCRRTIRSAAAWARTIAASRRATTSGFSTRPFSASCTKRGTAFTIKGCGPSSSACRRATHVSLGIHESQSRMWENLVGRSRAFWQHFFPRLQAAFPAAVGDVKLDDFYSANLRLKHRQKDALKVRAGIPGVLQELPVQVGQRSAQGTILAKVVQPEHLKAELKIPETQAKDIIIGQKAEIDTHNGVVEGTVSRIDPAVLGRHGHGGREAGWPAAKRRPPGPERGWNHYAGEAGKCAYVGRPAFGQEKSTVAMFKLDPDGKTATRVQVETGTQLREHD